jgi:AcrR family transcriptional regulator
MARPRIPTDDDLLSSAAAVLAEVGPSQFTLAKAAARAGAAPATYVKGSTPSRGSSSP